jgi:hypothetical protein
LICIPVSDGKAFFSSKATPVTWGVAIDVPDHETVAVLEVALNTEERIETPGAASWTSGP